MKALLTAELYRVFRQKSTYIILAVSFLFLTFNACMLGLALGNVPWLTAIHENLISSGMLEQYYGEAFIEQYQQVVAMRPDAAADFIALIFRGDLIFFLAFFAVCFSAAEKKYGYIQHYAAEQGRSRLFLAHSLILFLFSAAMMILSFFGSLMVTLIFFKGLPFGNALLLFGYLLVLLIVFASVGNLMLVVIDLIKNTRTCAWVIFGYLLIGSSLLYNILDLIFSGIAGSSFSVRILLPVGSLSAISFSNPGTLLTSLMSGVIFLIFTFLLELYYFKNRDLMV